MQLDWLIERFF